jgi:hypothetical protein
VTSLVLPAGSFGIDAAGFAHLASFDAAVEAGYVFPSMYVGGIYDSGHAAVERAWAAGMVVQLNYERDAQAALGGASVGHSYTQDALRRCHNDYGWEGESPLVFSPCDFSVTTSQFPACDAWHHAMVDDMLADGSVGGTYGPPFYLRHLSMQPWWPDDFVLWQWAGAGAVEPWTWAKQVFKPTHDVSHIGVAVDEDVTVKPYPFWSGYGPNDPIKPEEGDTVPLNADDLNAISSTLQPVIQTTVFNVVLGLWREPEIGNILAGNAQKGAAAALAANPPTPAVVDVHALAAALAPLLPVQLTAAQIESACELAVKTVVEQTTYTSVPTIGA